jgi:hypothetical protein
MKRLMLCVLLTGMLGLAGVAMATEGGGGAYPNGAEGFMTGAMPPPGLYLIDYALYYTADTFKGAMAPPDFDLTVAGNVFRLVNVTDKTFLGGTWAQHIFVPVLYQDVSVMGMDDDKFGLGDLIVDPFILGWHKPPFHWAAGVDIYVPVGAYDKDDLANLGRNYWTIEPVLAVTYLNQKGCEASVKLMYDINTENTDTDYESGDEFHCDFVLAKHFENLSVGVGGYYYKQVTGDDGTVPTPAGPVDAGDNKGEQLALGPHFMYKCGPLMFVAKWQIEMDTENKPEGDRFWLKLIAPLGGRAK